MIFIPFLQCFFWAFSYRFKHIMFPLNTCVENSDQELVAIYYLVTLKI